jgi:hypothetical protein
MTKLQEGTGMRKILSIFGLVALVAFVRGCGEEAAPKPDLPDLPDLPNELTIWSIDGTTHKAGEEPAVDEYFRGWPVLGKIEITDAEERAAIFEVFEAGFEDVDEFPKCFNPRHGISVVYGKTTTDYLICFECSQLKMFAGREEKTIGTTQNAEKELNRYLTAAGIELATGSSDTDN